jgi:TolA-binding protein
METSYTTFIERYYNGKLSPDELIQFNKLKSENEDFIKELELFESAQFIVELSALQELKEKVKSLDKANQPTHSLKSQRILGVAASIILLMIASVLFYAQTFSNKSLYSKSFTPASDYISELGSDNSELELALSIYNKGKYQEALRKFNTIKTDESQFYAGQCNLQLKNFTEAVNKFNSVQGIYTTEAQWYLALTHLKLNKEQQAILVLDQIIKSNQDPLFVKKSKKLKSKLKHPLRRLAL